MKVVQFNIYIMEIQVQSTVYESVWPSLTTKNPKNGFIQQGRRKEIFQSRNFCV